MRALIISILITVTIAAIVYAKGMGTGMDMGMSTGGGAGGAFPSGSKYLTSGTDAYVEAGGGYYLLAP